MIMEKFPIYPYGTYILTSSNYSTGPLIRNTILG